MNDRCYAAWRATFQALTERGYLSSYQEVNDWLGIDTPQLTSEGNGFFHPLMAGSIFWVVKVTSDPPDDGVKIVQIQREKRQRALVEFRFPTSEPFSLMWHNRVFTPECRRGAIGRWLPMP